MSTKNEHDWAVIGAGPAGMAAVGQLLEHEVPAEEILWLDPEFKVGDFGSRWLNIPSNTKVKLFNMFLKSCKAFEIDKCPHSYD